MNRPRYFRRSMPLAILLCATSTGVADGPVVPGVKSCVVEDDLGVYDFSYLCDWSQVCCLSPVYSPCPFPPGGSCIAMIYYTCCDPLEDCWYQRQGNKIVVWCGGPFPP